MESVHKEGKMKNAMLKEAFQDEIRESCVECGVDRLIAYWDEELEYYIYMSDTDICDECEPVVKNDAPLVLKEIA